MLDQRQLAVFKRFDIVTGGYKKVSLTWLNMMKWRNDFHLEFQPSTFCFSWGGECIDSFIYYLWIYWCWNIFNAQIKNSTHTEKCCSVKWRHEKSNRFLAFVCTAVMCNCHCGTYKITQKNSVALFTSLFLVVPLVKLIRKGDFLQEQQKVWCYVQGQSDV